MDVLFALPDDVALKGLGFFAAARIPHDHGAVNAYAHDALLVGSQGRASHLAVVPLEGPEVPARGGVPDFHRLVPTGAHDALAVAAHRHARDDARGRAGRVP